MKHYWRQSNLGLSVLLAGSWGLPAAALEVMPRHLLATDATEKATAQPEMELRGELSSSPPSLPAPSQLSAFSSLAVTPALKPKTDSEIELEWSFPEAPFPKEAEPLASSRQINVSDDLFDQASVSVPPLGRFEPEFAQAVPMKPAVPTTAPLPIEASAPPTVERPPLADSELLEQGGASQSEAAEQIDTQAEEILDSTVVPAGDLLESVDGLEDRGIAGEGVGDAELGTAEQDNPAGQCSEQASEICEPGGEASEGDPEEMGESPLSESQLPESQLPETQPLDNSVSEETEADEALDAQELNSEEFDSEPFEAEAFDSEAFDIETETPGKAEPRSEAAEPAADEPASAGDPDLGVLLLRPRPLPKPKSTRKVPVFLVGNVGYIANGNTLAGVDPVNDRLFRSGLSVIASPRLSKRTALIASVQGNLYRYDELSRLDYNELRLQASLRHVMTQRVYGDLGWTHRQLFLQDDGDRFLYEHAAFANLTRRDPITQKTGLTSFYNVRVSFADPETSSRLRNTLGVSLRHDITPALQASLTSRMTLTNFTQQSRQDFYIQGLAQLSYKISKHVRLSTFASLTRGNSSNRRVDFDNSTVGISLSGNVKLF